MIWNIWTKIKLVVGAIIVSLLPVLYVLGRREGRENAEADRAVSAASRNRDLAAFYRNLENENAKIDTLRTRDDLVDRVRTTGL